MPSIQIAIPSMLADCTGGRTRVSIEAETVGTALTQMREQFPLLRVHVFDESDRPRPHVLIFYNDQSIALVDALEMPVKQGDRLTIVQAVSGGA